MNFRCLLLIALSGFATLSSAGALTCAAPVAQNYDLIVVSKDETVSVPALFANDNRRDWKVQAPFAVELPKIAPDKKMEFVFPESMNSLEDDFVMLFYLGDEITLDVLSGGRWAGIAASAQFRWDAESQVGGIALAGPWSHLHLAHLIPTGRHIIGGVRYTHREQKNSTVFYSLYGPLVESLFFTIRF